MSSKKSLWGWIVVIIILIAIMNISAYFLIIKDNTNVSEGGNTTNVPSLEDFDFPDLIGRYRLRDTSFASKDSCTQVEDSEICLRTARIDYEEEDNSVRIVVIPQLVTKGLQEYIIYMNTYAPEATEEVAPGVFRGAEYWELGWHSEDYMMGVQQYGLEENADGSTSFSFESADVDNPVISYFLKKYPSTDVIPIN